MNHTTNTTIMIRTCVNVQQATLNGKDDCVITCQWLFHRHHSDYGYESSGGGCVKVKGYDVSKHCTVGQKTYVKSSTGRRLIPGDLCTNPQDFVTFTNETCTGYDYDAGVDNPSDSDNDNTSSKVQWWEGLSLLAHNINFDGIDTFHYYSCTEST